MSSDTKGTGYAKCGGSDSGVKPVIWGPEFLILPDRCELASAGLEIEAMNVPGLKRGPKLEPVGSGEARGEGVGEARGFVEKKTADLGLREVF